MPQLEIATYFGQIFWFLVIFLGLWFFMAKFIIPKIAFTIEERERKYADLIRKAEEINQKALDALNRYEEALAAAKEKTSKQVELREKELEDYISQKEEEMNSELYKKISENEQQLEKETTEIFNKISDISELTAYAVVKQLNLSAITQKDLQSISNRRNKQDV
jgi:F-type H+-transporting ATPase subunit b